MIPLLLSIISYFLLLWRTGKKWPKKTSKNFSFIVAFIMLFAMIVVFANPFFDSIIYKNMGSGSEKREIVFFREIDETNVGYKNVSNNKVYYYKEKDKPREYVRKDFNIYESNNNEAYVVKHYNKRLIRSSLFSWMFSPMHFLRDKEETYYDKYDFYIPKNSIKISEYYSFGEL